MNEKTYSLIIAAVLPQDRETYKKYFGFREVYLEYTKEENKNCSWFLISDIRKIATPIQKRRIVHGKYELPGFMCKYGQFLTNHLSYGGTAFVHTIPKECNTVISSLTILLLMTPIIAIISEVPKI